jgi:hypothetical protein
MNKLAIILFIVGGVIPALFFLYRFLLQFTTKPVLEINLTSSDDPRWSDKKKIAELMEAFKRNEFDLAGQYECGEIPGLIIAGFVKPSEQMTGVIYDHPIAGIWSNVCVQYADGENLTVSNAPMGQEMDHMPQSTIIYCKGGSVDELLAKVLTEVKSTGRKTISKEEFSSTFEDAYRKEMKWRMERGGPTSLEVKRVADKMGMTLDAEKMQSKTQQLQKIWMKEKSKPEKIKVFEADLPNEFQKPEVFRQRLEQRSSPVPQMNFQPLPVYTVFILTLVCWCYYGYQYNDTHRPVSFTALIIFLSVFLVFFVAMMRFREYNRRVRMYPVLKRIADMRPGAFLFIAGTSTTLFYVREGWIGKVIFREGGENQAACTHMEAVTKHSGGWLLINRKGLLNKVFGRSDKDNIPLPDGDFSRKFTMSGTDKIFAEKLLSSNVACTVMRLEEFEKPFVDIDGRSVVIEISSNLAIPSKEAELRKFLEIAENIVDEVVQEG